MLTDHIHPSHNVTTDTQCLAVPSHASSLIPLQNQGMSRRGGRGHNHGGGHGGGNGGGRDVLVTAADQNQLLLLGPTSSAGIELLI